MSSVNSHIAPLVIAILALILPGCASNPSHPVVTSTSIDAPVPDGSNATAQSLASATPVTALPSTDIELPESDEDVAPDEILVESVWHQYRKNTLFDLNQENPRITAQRNWYLSNIDYINRVLDRAEPYLYYVQSELNRRGLPSELLLLPIVESAYDPFAYSHGRAAGMWQFIPGTGRVFGLKQTWWYEGRRDVVASTDAALTYLDALQKQFDGNWELALASYNAGAGNVRKAISANQRKGKPTDFWSLNLRPETSAYVPKLIALAQIFQDPARYQLSIRDIPFEPYFTAVDVKSQIDLAQAADMAGIPIEELYKLNPAFNRWATDPEGPHRLLIPVVQANQFQLELDNLPPDKRVRWDRYTIRSGDTVSTISRRFHITPELLKSVNSMSSNNLRAGKTLMIPQSTQPLQHYALSADQRLMKKMDRTVQGKKKAYHTVAPGETLWQLSRRYNVDVKALASWNGMAPGDSLSQGRKLVFWTNSAVPAASQSLAQNRVRKINYKARSGDSYAGIADKFNISLHQLKRWNKVDLKRYLQPGDMLTLYVDIANAP